MDEPHVPQLGGCGDATSPAREDADEAGVPVRQVDDPGLPVGRRVLEALLGRFGVTWVVDVAVPSAPSS